MRQKTTLSIALLFCLFFSKNAYANLIFPAISRQFMISTVVPSYYSVIMAMLILIVEAYFIKKLFVINFFWSFIFSFIVNLISSVVGIFLTGGLFGQGGLSGLAGIFGYNSMRLGTYLGLIPGYVLTFILDGLLLKFIALISKSEASLKGIFKTSAVMNLFSYMIILFGIFITDVATKGKVFKTF